MAGQNSVFLPAICQDAFKE